MSAFRTEFREAEDASGVGSEEPHQSSEQRVRAGDPAPHADLADQAHVVHLALGQNRVLELIATGSTLRETLEALIRLLEQDAPEMLCSILLLDADGSHLVLGAAPSLPPAYSEAIDGEAIGPCAGSCGTAAFRRERVVVTDIETDPLWSGYRELARAHGLRACWSTPIFGKDETLLGTFAMYFKKPGSPGRADQRIIEVATHVASVAIGKEAREKAIFESEERYRLLNLATNDAVWDWDIHKNTLWWNDGVQRLFGYTADEVSSAFDWWVERVHADDRDRVHHSLRATAEAGRQAWYEEYRFRRKDGSYADIQDRGYVMRDAAGATTRMIGMMQDISERKQAETTLRELAYREPVTGLPNRAALQVHLAEAVAAADSSGEPFALLLVNLDYFRDINDALGHLTGDLLLECVAQRLCGALGKEAQVACLGGDEFAILVPHCTGHVDVEALVYRIQDCLQHPVQLGNIPVKTDATVGVTLYPTHGDGIDVLWQHADIALRTAKERHAPYLVYETQIDRYDPTRLALSGELRAAIDEEQLLLHYQPKLDLRSGRTTGVEALVRWQHPTRGLIFPDTFIPLAERTGLIDPLTTAVVVGALRQGMAWHAAGFCLDVSVNLSARNLHDPRFAPGLLTLVGEIGFPLSRLTLEITETAIMSDPCRAKAVLAQLHEAGISLSMDDFGIGQSSLTYLKDLPITKMKIDKSFIMDFAQPRNVAIVRSAIDLARNMSLEVTAEGIEDEATYLALRELGCDLAQGYFFSRPLAVDKLETWLRDSKWGYADATSTRVASDPSR